MIEPNRIVFCALGAAYRAQASLAVRSLRRVYDGPIDLIVERPLRNLDATCCVVHAGAFCHPSAAKLRIADVLGLPDSKTVLYLDCDFLAVGPLRLPDPGDKVGVYSYPKRSQRESVFAGGLTRRRSILRQQPFNAGALYFRPSLAIRDGLNAAYSQYYRALNHRRRQLPCWDQPYVNVELCARGLAEPILNPFIGEARDRPAIPRTAVLIHFCAFRKGAGKAMLEWTAHDNATL